MTTSDTMVTGGTGFIGRWLLAALTARGRHVLVPIRDAKGRAEGLRAHVARLGGDPGRLNIVSGDLERDDLGLGAHDGVRDVFHTAGLYAWKLDRARARAVNVDGTLRVLRWAAARPNLRRFVHLGGYRMTRLPAWIPTDGPVDEATLARMYRVLGAYEASKIESQLALVREAETRGVALTIVSPATVTGDSRTGETIQRTGVAETLGMLWRGKMPIGVGTEQTFVPLVPVDTVADVLATVPDNPQTRGQELVVLDPETPALPGLLREVGAHVGVEAPSRTLPKRWVAALPEALTGVVRETLSFLSEDRYDVASTQAHMQRTGLRWPARAEATARWVDHLVSTRFGEDPQAKPGHFREVAGSRTFVVGQPERASAVLLHGLPWDAESWRPLLGAWSEDVARVDLPGLGRSTPSDGDDVAWLHALLAERTEPVLLVGHSWGSGLALRYAAAHPERVAGLVLVSPYFLQGRAPAPLRCATLSTPVLRRLSADALGRDGKASRPVPAVATTSAAAQLHRPGVARRTAITLAAANTHAHRRELAQALRSVAAPSLVVHGEFDPLLEAVPGAVSIAEAGHAPHLTHPHEVAAAIRRWSQAVSVANAASRARSSSTAKSTNERTLAEA